MQSIDPDKGSSILFTVKKLIDFKLLTDSIVSEAFSNNEDLKNAQKDAFGSILNQEVNQDSSAHYLSIFIHKMMQKENALSKSKELMKEVKTIPY